MLSKDRELVSKIPYTYSAMFTAEMLFTPAREVHRLEVFPAGFKSYGEGEQPRGSKSRRL